jgi:hypothetical protein
MNKYRVTYWTKVENLLNLSIYKEDNLIIEGSDSQSVIADFEYYNNTQNKNPKIKMIELIEND